MVETRIRLRKTGRESRIELLLRYIREDANMVDSERGYRMREELRELADLIDAQSRELAAFRTAD